MSQQMAGRRVTYLHTKGEGVTDGWKSQRDSKSNSIFDSGVNVPSPTDKLAKL